MKKLQTPSSIIHLPVLPHKSPPRGSSFGATPRRPHHLFYRLFAKKNTFSHLIRRKGGHYFQHFNLINSNNLSVMFELQRNGFLFWLTCCRANRGPLSSRWVSETPCERCWEKGFFRPERELRPLSTLGRDSKGPYGWLRESEFCTVLCSTPRKRSGTRNP